MRFASIGSGSRGNGTLVEKNTTCLLVDCGFSVVDVQRRMARLGRRPEDLTAILLTHEHSDHIRGVRALAKKYAIPVWMTHGTAMHFNGNGPDNIRFFTGHETFVIGDIEIKPYPVPHDAREPCQFVFGDGSRRFGILTDVGSSTRHIEASLNGCDALMLEANHDYDMLLEGNYPSSLKQRVGGEYGHLSNVQAASLLKKIDCSRLQHIVAVHLSEKNNTPLLARQALSAALDCTPEWIAVADQEAGFAWREVV